VALDGEVTMMEPSLRYRILQPLRKYRRYVTDDLRPFYVAGEIAAERFEWEPGRGEFRSVFREDFRHTPEDWVPQAATRQPA
jgi:hypothetical protein